VPSARLIQELKDRYGVGPEYASTYLAFWTQPGGRHAGREFASVDEILELPPPDSVWFDYAMSTNRRGRDLCDLIFALPQLSRAPRRFLDVGCGFGGLLAAFAGRGYEVRGIEIDAERVGLARANCRDHGRMDADEVVTAGDILDDRLVDALGRHDVVTVVDVIEHVLDVPRALAHVARLLNPGGLALLEIPNRHSLRFVARDGHFSLFGITLLDREQAMAYHRSAFRFAYDVGDYFNLDDYRRQLEGLGCQFAVVGTIPEETAFGDVPALVEGMRSAFERYVAETRPGLPPSVDAALQVNLGEYTAALARDYQDALADSGRRPAFEERYLPDFWRVVAVKAP